MHGNPLERARSMPVRSLDARLKTRFRLRSIRRTRTGIGAQERTDSQRSFGSLALFGCPIVTYISSKFLISLGHPI
jgi:hypothetical protein